MGELIKVQHDNDHITVLVRDLYGLLEIESNFTTWFRRTYEYGFEEARDSIPFLEESTGGRPATDYQITIEMAREITMIQRNEKGKQTRQYLIQPENDWNSPQKVMARALQVSQRKLQILRTENEEVKPLALFASAVKTSDDGILIGQLAKLIKQDGHDMGQNRLFAWMRKEGYLCSKGENCSMPTQKSMGLGLMEIKERTVNNPDSSVKITKTSRITGKGQIYFVNRPCGGFNI